MGCSYRPLRRTQHLLSVLSAEEVVCVKSIILKIKSTQKNAWSVALCTHICYSHNPTGSWDLSFSIGSGCPRWGQTPGSFLPVFQGSSAYGWIKKKKHRRTTFIGHNRYLWILTPKDGISFGKNTQTGGPLDCCPVA